MGLTKQVLRRPVTTFLVVLCLLVFGLSSVIGSKMELTPDMEMPMLVVYAIYPGANPEDVDELVTHPIEDKISTLNGVDTVTSYSNENASFVLLQYEYGTNMDSAYNDLKKSMDAVKSGLPDGVETPSIMEFNINDMASMTVAVNNDAEGNLYNYVDNNIKPELEKLGSVASIDVSGGRQEYIKVEALPEKLTQYHLSISQLADAVASADTTYPAGSTKSGSQSLSVSTGQSFKDMESLKNIPITLPGGSTIYLQDVANVYSTLDEATSIGRYDGKDTITLGLHMTESSSANEMSRDVHRVMDNLMAANDNLQMVVVDDNSDSITGSLKSVGQTMIMAVVISMAIIWLFFGDIKASLIVGTSIPVSILAALIGMSLMGFSLNVVTLGALVLGVGMMVDNSIVTLESCFRATDGVGFDKFHEAALKGSGTVLMSIVGSTLTTCVVFLPLATISGLAGQMFKPLGFTIVFCMLASLISAMTLVPLCYMMYKPVERKTAPLSAAVLAMQNAYRKLMGRLLHRKKLVMLSSVGLLIFSFVLATQIRTELMPATDQGTIQISVEMRPGTEIGKVDDLLKKVEDYVTADPDLKSYMISYGSSGMNISSGSSATLMAYLKKDRSRSTQKVINDWKPVLTAMPDMDITLESYSQTGMSGQSNSDVSFILQGTQYDDVKAVSDQVADALKGDSRVQKVHSSMENAAPVVKLRVDPLKAQAEGLSAPMIGGAVNMMLSGKEATTLNVDGDDISVQVRYPDGEYEDIDDVRGIILTNPAGGQVALTDVADVIFEDSPQSIERENRQYQVTITAAYGEGLSKKEQAGLQETLFKDVVTPNLKNGVSRADDMSTRMQNDEFASLGKAILIAIFLVFVVMAAQFESPKFSLMVMTTIPFSLIGVFGFLFIFDVSISMTSLLGFLMLVGTVVNNGILYVDTADQYRATMDQETALIEAGATRLRPILMTTLTTVVSMIPMAVGYGENGEIMQGLALVNVGGLTAATILSLIMLPAYYAVMNRKKTTIYDDID